VMAMMQAMVSGMGNMGSGGQPSAEQKAEAQKASKCAQIPMKAICGSLCTDTCKNDQFVKDLLGGGLIGNAESPESETEKLDVEKPDKCKANEGGAPMTDMDEMLGPMCTKNTDGDNDFYCMDKYMELSKGGAFAGESAVDEFPDMCKIDCTTATGKAIATLGCCNNLMLDMMEKGGVSLKELRTAKAVVEKCGGAPALNACAGTALPTAILSGSKTVQSCPADKKQEMAEKKGIAKKLNVATKSVRLMTCGTKEQVGCLGRRLEDGPVMKYRVKVTAESDAALKDKQTSLEKQGLESAPTPAPADRAGRALLSATKTTIFLFLLVRFF